MSFDTTARQRVAPGAEEQEMPACLPLVSFLGDARADMQYETSTGITATFKQKGSYGVPSVTLSNVPGIPGEHQYNASQFLDSAAIGEGFFVGAVWDDQSPFLIETADVNGIAQMVRANADRTQGYFESRWVALDPSAPF